MTLFFTAILLAGCAPPLTEENAAQQMAGATCSKLKNCKRATYDTYNNRADCVEDYQDGFQILIDGFGLIGLELDLDETRSCLTDLKAASCEDWEDNDFSNDCDDVFTF